MRRNGHRVVLHARVRNHNNQAVNHFDRFHLHCRRPVPLDADLPPSLGVNFVAAGPNGSAAVTCAGELYCWGASRLGIEPKSLDVASNGGTKKKGTGAAVAAATVAAAAAAAVVLHPTRVDGMRGGQRVKNVSLASKNIAVLTVDGAVYLGGDNTYGQLGVDRGELSHAEKTEYELRRLSALADTRLQAVALGETGALGLVETFGGEQILLVYPSSDCSGHAIMLHIHSASQQALCRTPFLNSLLQILVCRCN